MINLHKPSIISDIRLDNVLPSYKINTPNDQDHCSLSGSIRLRTIGQVKMTGQNDCPKWLSKWPSKIIVKNDRPKRPSKMIVENDRSNDRPKRPFKMTVQMAILNDCRNYRPNDRLKWPSKLPSRTTASMTVQITSKTTVQNDCPKWLSKMTIQITVQKNVQDEQNHGNGLGRLSIRLFTQIRSHWSRTDNDDFAWFCSFA